MSTRHCNCFLDSLVSIFNPGLKQPQKCLVSWKSDSSGGGGGCLAIIARCSSVPAKRQTTMRVDNGGIVAVHRSTLFTLWGGGEAIKGSCASRPIHLNSREWGDGSLFISTTHQRGRGLLFIQAFFTFASPVQYQNDKIVIEPTRATFP